jgi:hypothetical protein
LHVLSSDSDSENSTPGRQLSTPPPTCVHQEEALVSLVRLAWHHKLQLNMRQAGNLKEGGGVASAAAVLKQQQLSVRACGNHARVHHHMPLT